MKQVAYLNIKAIKKIVLLERETDSEKYKLNKR